MPATVTVTVPLGDDVLFLLAFVVFLVATILALAGRGDWALALIATGLALTVLPNTPLV